MAGEQLLPAVGMAFLTLGVSADAQALEKAVQFQPVEHNVRPIAYSDPFDAVARELAALCEECGEDNWDGYGAQGLSPVACNRAMKLLHALPYDLPAPELSAMPNGDVALDWDFAPRRTITVTVAASPRLAYAAIDGDEEWSGTVSFTSTFPESIHGAIERLSLR